MWFLYYYIISTLLAFVVTFIVSASIKSRMKREHPEMLKCLKLSMSKEISGLLPLLVPVFNNILTLVMIFAQDEVYLKATDKLTEENKNETDESMGLR